MRVPVPQNYDSWNDYIETEAPALATAQGITLQQAKATIKLSLISSVQRGQAGQTFFREFNSFTSWATRAVWPEIGRPWRNTPPLPSLLYSNFSTYFVNNERVTSLSALTRSNVFINRQFVVTESITINSFRFVRIPPTNWSSITTVSLFPTLQVAGGGATINGGATSVPFFEQELVLNPVLSVDRTGDLDQYDTFTMSSASGSVVLTPGTYNISMNASTGNLGMAILDTTTYPVDTSGVLYPTPTVAGSTYLVMEVI